MEDYEADYIEKANLEARLHNAEFMIHIMAIIIKDTLPAGPSYQLNLMLKQYFDASQQKGAFKDAMFK